MHELSLLENVREIMENHTRSQNFNKVIKVTLEIGKLSSMESRMRYVSAFSSIKGSFF